ncbi:unnamed protein product [Closterium sp. NIES-54]
MVLIHPSIISSVATRLGRKWEDEEGKTMYEKGEDCLGSLRDLQRLMRRDHPVSRDVLVQLGRWDIVRTDLVPIICRYRCDSSLLLNAVKLLVFLTMPSPPPPPDLDAAGRQQQQKLRLEHHGCQRRFKSALVHGNGAVTSGLIPRNGGAAGAAAAAGGYVGSGESDAIAIVLQLLVDPLKNIQSGRGSSDDWRLVQMIVTLVRNLLAIPDPPPDVSSASAWAHLCFLQDDLIRSLFRSSFQDILLFLISCLHAPETAPALRHDNLLFLEILNLLFRELPPKDAAVAAFRAAGEADAEADAREDREAAERLAEARQREKERAARKALAQKITQRHSRFGGLYVVRNADKSRTVSSTPFSPPVHHAIFSQVRRGPVRRVMGGTGIGMGLDGGLNGDGDGGNGGDARKPDADVDAALGLVGGTRANRRSSRWTARRLGVFADRLLASGCYNVLMETVRRDVAAWRAGLEALTRSPSSSWLDTLLTIFTLFLPPILPSPPSPVLMETVRRDVAAWRPGLEPSDMLTVEASPFPPSLRPFRPLLPPPPTRPPVLMETVRRDVAAWRPGLEPSDTLAFFLVASFFTAFQREMHGLWGDVTHPPLPVPPLPPSSAHGDGASRRSLLAGGPRAL